MRIEDISQNVWELLFAVRVSVRYHDRRERFFTAAHRTTAGLGALFGSTTVAAMFGTLDNRVGLIAATVVTVVFVADLVVGFSISAALHRDLKRRFIDLEAAIIDAHTDEQLGAHQKARLTIEKDEPPIYRALEQMCHNDVVRASLNEHEAAPQFVPVSWWQRVTAQWLEHGNNRVLVQR